MAHGVLEDGLDVLGQVLADEGQSAEIVVIGAGALCLLGELERPTADLDIVARVQAGRLRAAHPLPNQLVDAIRRVGRALDLPHEPRDAKDWLNAGPSFLFEVGLPAGFESRLVSRTYGGLTVHLASRLDLIALKFYAATDGAGGPRRLVHIADLEALRPSTAELDHAVDWSARVDGRPDESREARALRQALAARGAADE